jgi:hypothetical protein
MSPQRLRYTENTALNMSGNNKSPLVGGPLGPKAKAKSKNDLTTEATLHREHRDKHTRKTSNRSLVGGPLGPKAKAKSKNDLTTEATRHREHRDEHVRKTSNRPL